MSVTGVRPASPCVCMPASRLWQSLSLSCHLSLSLSREACASQRREEEEEEEESLFKADAVNEEEG